jgi:hypothetical protein
MVLVVEYSPAAQAALLLCLLLTKMPSMYLFGTLQLGTICISSSSAKNSSCSSSIGS